MDRSTQEMNFEMGFRAYLIGVAISNSPAPLDLSFLFNLRTEVLLAFVGGVVGRVPTSASYQKVMNQHLEIEQESHKDCSDHSTKTSICN